MEPTEVVSVMPKRGPSSPKIIVDTNLTVQNSSAIRPTPVKAGKSITHLDNNKQVQVSCLLLFLVLTYTTLHISDSSVMEFSFTDEGLLDIVNCLQLKIYRGSLPCAHFGTWKKPCYMKFMLVGL